jgi:hypothetical protein
MSVEDNKAVVVRWFTDFRGSDFDADIIDELAAPDIRFEDSLHKPLRGRDEVREFALRFREAFPDLGFGATGDLRVGDSGTLVTGGRPTAAQKVAWAVGAAGVPDSPRPARAGIGGARNQTATARRARRRHRPHGSAERRRVRNRDDGARARPASTVAASRHAARRARRAVA